MPQLDTSFFITQLFWLAIFFSLTYIFISTEYLPTIASIFKFNKKKIAEINKEIVEIRKASNELDNSYVTQMSDALAFSVTNLNESHKKAIQWTHSTISQLNTIEFAEINTVYLDTMIGLDYMYNEWQKDNQEYWVSQK